MTSLAEAARVRDGVARLLEAGRTPGQVCRQLGITRDQFRHARKRLGRKPLSKAEVVARMCLAAMGSREERIESAADVERIVAEQAKALPAWWGKESPNDTQYVADDRPKAGKAFGDAHALKRGYKQSPWGSACPLLRLFDAGVRVGTPAMADADEWLRGEEGVALLAAGTRARATSPDGGATVNLTWAGGEVVFVGKRKKKTAGGKKSKRGRAATRFREDGHRFNAMEKAKKAAAV